jgi:HEAT repeat protein/sugar phosphate isomerase/epimerase/type 1 glutamine amidotransferase
MQRIATAICLSVCLATTLLAARTEPVPLNDHTRLGQKLTATMPWNGIWIISPSWSDNEGGFTLSLWDSPKRGKLLARKTFVDFQDNARLDLWLPKTAAPGTLYWEIHDRVGQTRVGLYSRILEQEVDDCAYLDGVADRKRTFNSGLTYSPGRHFASVDEMLSVLQSDASLADRKSACRELAIHGGRKAVPVLAKLLPDPDLSHLARYALEPIPDPAVDEAFRDALGTLEGDQLIGVVNSIGVRRGAEATKALTKLLEADTPSLAAAAAVALGKIGTPATARALARALDNYGDEPPPAILEGCLNCADQLFEKGRIKEAKRLWDLLRDPKQPVHIREAALRGAMQDDLPLLLRQFQVADSWAFRAALWTAQRRLPGAEATQAIAGELGTLPPERQALLVEALGGRGDAAALPALKQALTSADKKTRLAAVRNLPKVGSTVAIPPLVDAMASPDTDLAKAARYELKNLHDPAVDKALIAAVGTKQKNRRRAAMELLGQRRSVAAVPALLEVTRDPDPELRVVALGALRDIAGKDQVPELVQALGKATEPAERKAAESTLAAVCGRVGPTTAEPLATALPDANEATQLALLRILSRAGGKTAFDTVAGRLEDPRDPVRQEAFRLVTSWHDRLAVPRLLTMAKASTNVREQVLAIRGLVRLASPAKGKWGADVDLLATTMKLSQRPDEKRLALGIASDVASRQTLAIASHALADKDLQQDACTALVKIAEKLPRPGDGDIRVAMEQVLANSKDNALRARAEAVLAKHREAQASIANRLAGKLPAKAPATPKKSRKLLIFDVNVVYGGHPSRFAANEAFALMGQTTGAYETVLSRDPEVFRPESLKRFDAVLFNNTVGLPFEDPELQQSLAEFVYGGGGLMGIHGTTFAFIDWGGKRGDTWPEFGTMLGARGGSHGSQHEHVFVKLDDPTNPLNAVFGGKDFEYKDEYFRVSAPYSRDRDRVLFSIDAQKTDLASHKLPEELKRKDGDYPLAWVRRYGRGRVFYCTIGHNSSVFEDKTMLAFYLGAIQFALGDLPAPTLPSNALNPTTRAWEKLGWRLGMTTYSLHKYTFFEAIDKTTELGLPYINGLCFQKVSKDIPKNFGPALTDDEIKQIRLKLDAAHVTLLTHYIGDIPGDEAGCRKAFEFARKMGIETLIAEPKLAALDTIERFCDEYDVNLGIHNHGQKQSPNYWHPDKIMQVCKGRSKRIGACVDIGYWLRSSIDPIQGVKTLGDRLITIQMHDLNDLTPEGHDVPWGTGAGRTKELLQTIHELGVTPTMFGLEYSYDWLDNMPEMAECAKFFNQVAVELAR